MGVTKDAWAKPTLRQDKVWVEEFDDHVLIRELPANVSADLKGLLDLTQVGDEQRAKIDVATMECRQFAYGVIDANGEPMFSEAEVLELQQKHGRAFRTVVDAIDEFSGIDKKAVEEAETRFPARGTPASNGREEGNPVSAGGRRPDHEASAGA
jgi:hypothetical protein